MPKDKPYSPKLQKEINQCLTCCNILFYLNIFAIIIIFSFAWWDNFIGRAFINNWKSIVITTLLIEIPILIALFLWAIKLKKKKAKEREENFFN